MEEEAKAPDRRQEREVEWRDVIQGVVEGVMREYYQRPLECCVKGVKGRRRWRILV